MRTIIFRGEWITGNLLSYPEEDLYLIEYRLNLFNFRKQVEKDTISQFTGVYDKNGVEIFENSKILIPGEFTVNNTDTEGVVLYGSDELDIGFYIASMDRCLATNWEQLEVIGTTFDETINIKEDGNL